MTLQNKKMVATFINFGWATMKRKILNGDISAKKEYIEL